MTQTLNILDNYTNWLKKYQLSDTDANFVIFLTSLIEEPDWADEREHQFEFNIIKDKESFGFVVSYWKSDFNGGWSIDDVQRKDFTTLVELILAIKQNNVVIWNKSEG